MIKTIASKGLKIWPRDDEYMLESDHWCCRFMPDSGTITHADINNQPILQVNISVIFTV